MQSIHPCLKCLQKDSIQTKSCFFQVFEIMNNMILSAATAHAAQNQLPISIPDEKSMTHERISTEPVSFLNLLFYNCCWHSNGKSQNKNLLSLIIHTFHVERISRSWYFLSIFHSGVKISCIRIWNKQYNFKKYIMWYCSIRNKMGFKYFLPLFDEKHKIASWSSAAKCGNFLP